MSDPTTSFAALGVPAALLACLERLGVNDPYPIQTATLPEGLAGRDLFAQSPTGSGKTLAFAIPVVARIGRAGAGRPRALVLAPTRELAAQIAEATRPLAVAAGRRVAVVYGGVGYGEQLTALRRGTDILVGCPGRLLDLVERRALDLSEVEVAVVDEADRMADMGFLPVVRRLLAMAPRERQTMLFSATLTGDVERLVREHQHEPARHVLALPIHDVGSRRHEFWRSSREQRSELTAGLVAGHGSSIVFCRTKHGADRLARQLGHAGVVAVAIHGDRSQPQRERALEQFRQRRAQVLVGTDVASRGLHVDGVDCVVHFDPPADDDTYVHRSGRTGRAGASGLVVSLVSAEQERDALQLARRLGLGSALSEPPAAARAAAVRAAAAVRQVAPTGQLRPVAAARQPAPRRRAAGGQGLASAPPVGGRSRTAQQANASGAVPPRPPARGGERPAGQPPGRSRHEQPQRVGGRPRRRGRGSVPAVGRDRLDSARGRA